MKTCIKCRKERPEEDFYLHRKTGSWRIGKCKDCTVAESVQWRRDNPERANRTRRMGELKRKYGITSEEYENLEKAQNGVCAICGKPQNVKYGRSPFLCVDHDHTTGKIRGLLCYPCNLVVGNCLEDSRILEKTMIYLKTHKS